MKKLLIAGAAMASLAIAGHANAAFPGYGADSGGPGFLITLGAGNTVTFTATGQSGTYDGADDTYIGVVNNSGATVTSLNLSADADIFGFDSDGIDTYGAPSNLLDTSGYGGPDGYFTNVDTSAYPFETGTVNFIGGIPNGGTDYFSLEEALTAATFTSGGGGGITATGGVPEPSTWAMMLVGLGALGGVLRMARRKAVSTAAA